MPDKLNKFFPNKWEIEPDAKKPVNYSHQALIAGTKLENNKRRTKWHK
jgi:hypothetical protein